jgi:hypothetical protein
MAIADAGLTPADIDGISTHPGGNGLVVRRVTGVQ